MNDPLPGDDPADYRSRSLTLKLDLYDHREVERVCGLAAERLGVSAGALHDDLDGLTERLEGYMAGVRRAKSGGSTATNQPQKLTAAAEGAALAVLRSGDLIAVIGERLAACGITGERATRVLLFVVASSYKMPETLHVLIQGSSGSGKTRLLDVVARCMPAEDVKRFTRVTDNAFYNQAEDYFTHKLVCLEDLDGLREEAELAFRELQSSDVLRTATSVKNERGDITGGERVVRGPIASMACTTRGEVYEDNVSRCLVVAVDESAEQTARVIAYQNARAGGRCSAASERAARAVLADCVRLLEPCEVVNPYAERIALPHGAHKVRRLNELYLSFVRQVCLLNQYQRKKDARGRLVAEVADLRSACAILFESIVLKCDELDGSLRQFFERLKAHVAAGGSGGGTGKREREFDRHEVREALGVSKTQQHRYLSQLVALEYLRQTGHANRGYRYQITHWDDAAALRARIRADLNRQLDALT